MDALSVPLRWWTPQGGFDAAIDWSAEVVAVGVAGQDERGAARAAIRAALRAALAQWSGAGPDAVALHAEPGVAPYAIIDKAGAARRAWLAISHDGALSVAAIRFAGPVGIDLMQVSPVPDWETVARDYLGPVSAAALAALPAAERDAAFARSWAERESRIKCLGWQLDEWRAADEPALHACACLPLDLPAGYAGALALA